VYQPLFERGQRHRATAALPGRAIVWEQILLASTAQRRQNFHAVQNSFDSLIRLLVLLAFTFATVAFGSFWIIGLAGAAAWVGVAALRDRYRAA
jgi:hypothetical protein